jgi:hypothetical protein
MYHPSSNSGNFKTITILIKRFLGVMLSIKPFAKPSTVKPHQHNPAALHALSRPPIAELIPAMSDFCSLMPDREK